MEKNSKIYIAGHNGMVGKAIMDELLKNGYNNLIYKDSKDLDLRRQSEVEIFFEEEKPEYVFLSAAKVGGIMANKTYPAEFIYDNLMIETNIIHSAYKNNVKKLLFLGSSCIYPKNAPQPMKEEYLMTGELEPTNAAYSIAKITGIKLCEYYRQQYGCDFISVMPTNLYGINDNFNPETSHVIPGFIRRFHEAKLNGDKEVVMWGTGTPKREFMYTQDLAEAVLHIMLNYSDEKFINIGTGEDIEIKKLATLMKEVVGYKGQIVNDLSKPDGTPRKLLDITKLKETGYTHKVELKEGIERVYEWYLENK